MCLKHTESIRILQNYTEASRNLRIVNFQDIVTMWKNHFSHSFNVHFVDIRQKEIHTDHTLVAKCSVPEVQIERENSKIYKSPGNDYIPAQMIYSRGKPVHSYNCKWVNSVWSKEEFAQQWNNCTMVPIYPLGDKTD
jgi:hypothetical protein